MWDNASTDGSSKLAREAAANDERLRVFHAKNKTSLYEARNLALSHAAGQYVAFLDSDDLWSADKLDVAKSSLESSGASVFFSNFTVWDFAADSKQPAYRTALPKGNVLDIIAVNYPIAISTVVIAKSALAKINGPFDERFTIIGDFDLMLHLATSEEFVNSNVPLVTYRHHAGNLSHTARARRRSEVAIWRDSKRIGAMSNSVIFNAQTSLEIDLILSDNKSSLNKLLRLLGLTKNPASWSLMASKLVWWLSNRPLLAKFFS